jgi:D-aminopeptidase
VIHGPADAIADVAGVSVVHAEAGFTAVLPYPRPAGRRKIWAGCCVRGRVGEVTGLHVLRDFGTLSSPIVLCPLSWTGAVYDALIEEGFDRDANLSIDAGWPPIVFGLPCPGAPPASAAPGPAAVREALSGGGPISSSAGVARHWTAAGERAGVAAASLVVEGGGAVGVFAAVCGGPADRAAAAGARAAGGSGSSLPAPAPPVRVLVAATDAPLAPRSLAELAARTLEGVALAGLSGGGAGLAAVAFTTAQPVSGAFEPRARRVVRRELDAAGRAALADAARECARLAAGRALEA